MEAFWDGRNREVTLSSLNHNQEWHQWLQKKPQIPVDVKKNSIHQTFPTSNYFPCQSFPRILALRGDKLFVQSNKHFSLIKRQMLISCSDNIAHQWATATKNKAAFKFGRHWLFCDLIRLYHQQTLEKNTGVTRVYQQSKHFRGFLAPVKHLSTTRLSHTKYTPPVPGRKTVGSPITWKLQRGKKNRERKNSGRNY